MHIAVAGGTGVVGRYAVAAAEARGHDVRVLSRGRGVDVTSEEQLAPALAGVEVVIDAVNLAGTRRGPAEDFFTRSSAALQRVGATQGVTHLVTLSIVGIDRASAYGYYQAKLAQEATATAGPLPVTILRATQFHEFPAQVLSMTRKGPIAVIPRMRSQTVAARTVGEHLVAAAEQQQGGMLELAGPEVSEMPDLARKLLESRGIRSWVIPLPVPGAGGRALRSGALLATSSTTIDGPTFDEWLVSDDARVVPF
jgi:uncharacterized protein YbjT (DUF2867 family)